MILLLHSGVPVDALSSTQHHWQLESKHISTEVYGRQLTCERIWPRLYWFNGNEGNMLICVEQLVRAEEASHRKFKSRTRNLSGRRKCQPLANTGVYFSRSTVMHVSPALTGGCCCDSYPLQAYHSSLNEDIDVRQVGNMAILPIRTRIRGPAPIGTQRAQR